MKISNASVPKEIKVDLIDLPPPEDRLEIDQDYIVELASSIGKQGLLQAVLVRVKGDRYEIIAGRCRVLAHLHLGRPDIMAVVTKMSDVDAAVARATENLQRKDLTPIEEGRNYRNLHDVHKLSWDEISRRVGKSVGTVKRRYDLLSYPEILIQAMQSRKIQYTVAEVLSQLQDESRISYYLEFAIDHGATVSVVQEWVREEKSRLVADQSPEQSLQWRNPMPHMAPVYVPCDLCQEPMKVGEEVIIRTCKECVARLNQIMSGNAS